MTRPAAAPEKNSRVLLIAESAGGGDVGSAAGVCACALDAAIRISSDAARSFLSTCPLLFHDDDAGDDYQPGDQHADVEQLSEHDHAENHGNHGIDVAVERDDRHRQVLKR